MGGRVSTTKRQRRETEKTARVPYITIGELDQLARETDGHGERCTCDHCVRLRRS